MQGALKGAWCSKGRDRPRVLGLEALEFPFGGNLLTSFSGLRRKTQFLFGGRERICSFAFRSCLRVNDV